MHGEDWAYMGKIWGVTTDGSPNFNGWNVGLLTKIQQTVHETYPDHKVTFFHCIIHQEAHGKPVLDMNHVVKTAMKIVNLLRRLKHLQFKSLLEDIHVNQEDVPYHTDVWWLSLGKVIKQVCELRKYINSVHRKWKDKRFPQNLWSEKIQQNIQWSVRWIFTTFQGFRILESKLKILSNLFTMGVEWMPVSNLSWLIYSATLLKDLVSKHHYVHIFSSHFYCVVYSLGMVFFFFSFFRYVTDLQGS